MANAFRIPVTSDTARLAEPISNMIPEVSIAADAKKPLSQDTKLVSVLRGAVEASVREDGWALLSAAGSAAKRQAPVDPRNFGVKNFRALFEATGLFEIARAKEGQYYIADKRNKDRAVNPSR